MNKWVVFLFCGMVPSIFGKTLLLIPFEKASPQEAQETESIKIVEGDEGEIKGTLTKSSFNEETIEFLFKETLGAKFSGKVVLGEADLKSCRDKECASKAGESAGAGFVVYGTVRQLGSKVVFSATMLNRETGKTNHQMITASSVEEMDDVIQRMADALLAEENWKQVATLDNIVDKENEKIKKRRDTYYKKGFSLGYLFPVKDSYTYWDCDYDDFEENCEWRQFSQMIYLNMMNVWEFHSNLALNVDFNWAIPQDIGGDVNLLYFQTRTDFSPFYGGGIGLHYVFDGCASNFCSQYDRDKRRSGATFNGQLGFAFFRTYSLNLMTRVKYQVVTNSNFDNGPVVEVGVIHHNKEAKKSSGWASFWKWYLIAALFVSVVGTATGG